MLLYLVLDIQNTFLVSVFLQVLLFGRKQLLHCNAFSTCWLVLKILLLRDFVFLLSPFHEFVKLVKTSVS